MGVFSVLFGSEKENQLFQHLNRVADYGVQASQALLAICQDPFSAKKCWQVLKSIEHDCDQAVAQVFGILNAVSQLPFRHDDIAELVKKMDGIVDCIWGAIDRIVDRYELSEIEREIELLKLAEILNEMTVQLKDIIYRLKNLKQIRNFTEVVVKMHTQENEADDLRAEAVKRWHKASIQDLKNLPYRIAWAETYDRLEWATNKCVDVTDILDEFISKYL